MERRSGDGDGGEARLGRAGSAGARVEAVAGRGVGGGAGWDFGEMAGEEGARLGGVSWRVSVLIQGKARGSASVESTEAC